MKKLILRIIKQFKRKYIPNSKHILDFSKSRDIKKTNSCVIARAKPEAIPEIASLSRNCGTPRNDSEEKLNVGNQDSKPSAHTIPVRYPSSEPSQPPKAGSMSAQSTPCPYCNSKDTVKRGLRSKKYEVQQRHLCNACNRTFVAPKAKGKSFPLKIILEAISYYNTGFTLAESCRFLKEKSGLDVKEASLSNWLREKQNFATRIANLALQVVNDSKLRHKALQRFMLCNDSVTVATEVPVYMDEMDIEHMQEALNFKIPLKLDKVLTGHIDVLQVRNGAVHILDYKPQKSAKGQRPVSQLTIYALALSRLTGLRFMILNARGLTKTRIVNFFHCMWCIS